MLLQGVQPRALTKFPDYSLTFPWPFGVFPWPRDKILTFHYRLNTHLACNLTNHTPKLAITKNNNSIENQKYKVRCFKLPQDCAQWKPSELYTLVGQTVLLFLIIFYSLCGTKCKFPDFFQHSFFSLTFTKIPWLFPDFCQVWNFPDFSLTAGHPVLLLQIMVL